jgi:hypothetical protein
MQDTPVIDDGIDIVVTGQLEPRIVEEVRDVVTAAGEKAPAVRYCSRRPLDGRQISVRTAE